MPIREPVATPKPKRRKIEVVAAPPVPDPVYAPVLLHVDEHPPRVRDYVSPGDAGKCARQISYKLGGVEPDVAMGGTSGFVMAMGQFVGEYVAEGIRRDNPKALVVAEQPLHDYVATAEDDKIEPVVVETSNGDLPVIGFVDVTVEEEHLHDVVEVKSTGQYSFTRQTGWGYRSGTPEGPKPTHLGQGSIYGKLRAAKRLVMLLVNRDPLSAKQAPDDLARMAAEWHYTPEQADALALALSLPEGGPLTLTAIRSLGIGTTQQARAVADHLVRQQLLDQLIAPAP